MKTKLKELRTQAKLTQQQLADLVHVSARTIISIEKEQYSPSLMLATGWRWSSGNGGGAVLSEGKQGTGGSAV